MVIAEGENLSFDSAEVGLVLIFRSVIPLKLTNPFLFVKTKHSAGIVWISVR